MLKRKKESEDLFANDDEFSDEESPFRKNTGLFASDPRSNDDKDMFDSDLFVDKSKEAAKPAEKPRAPPAQKLSSAIPKKKVPDLFGDDDVSDDDIFNKLTRTKKPSLPKESFKPVKNKPDDTTVVKTENQEIKKETSPLKKTATSLFDDFNDDDKTAFPLPSNKKSDASLFEECDTFDLLQAKTTKKHDTEHVKHTPPVKPIKNQPDDTPVIKTENQEIKKETSPLKKTAHSLFDDFNDDDKTAYPLPSNKKSDTSLFEECDTFDLFKPKPTKKHDTEPVKYTPPVKPVKNKQDDTPVVKTVNQEIKKKTSLKKTAPSLFDDFNDVLITTKVCAWGIDVKLWSLTSILPLTRVARLIAKFICIESGLFGKYGLAINMVEGMKTMLVLKQIEEHLEKIDVNEIDDLEEMGKR